MIGFFLKLEEYIFVINLRKFILVFLMNAYFLFGSMCLCVCLLSEDLVYT